ncbi:MAG: glycosyltransferase [Gallionellaceae bacterium]|jgi:UDP:flavonoid glycosyltransferase YjiC (YdhE family)
MTNFLFAWELGANYGHLNRDRQVAECLRERGHHIFFAVKDTRIATELLAPHSFEFVQAPLPQTRARLLRPPANYAELLLAEGWGDQLSLIGRVSTWQSLFKLIKPDTLIADHAPTALLAAHIAGLPSLAFGNGFEIPPQVTPMPSIRPWENIEPARFEQSEKFVLEQINAVSTALGSKQLNCLLDLFPSKSVLATFAELDHYGERNNVTYAGSVHGFEYAEKVLWKKSHGPKILAYLRLDQKATEDVITTLAQAGEQAMCIVPGISQSQIRKFASPNLTIYPHPVAISPLLATADVMISYGGSGTIAETLLAGVPLILIPGVIEQYLGARAVEKLGAGILLGEKRDKNVILSAIKKVLSDPVFRQAAQGFSEKYRGCTSAHSAKLAAQVILLSVT